MSKKQNDPSWDEFTEGLVIPPTDRFRAFLLGTAYYTTEDMKQFKGASEEEINKFDKGR